MDSEEITKLVDGVYKNILEKFNPGARQLITAGKGYLKALHGAASASRLFNETLAKIAMNAQQNGTNDIGAALLNVVSVYKEIQEQQMNILKAFYVDLLVPLETNLEKDTKVVQHEQKKFLQQHKVRMESYHKAMATMKKQRKKKSSPENTEKELRSLQILEDQKKKLDAFCEQSYKSALTQERRRYGFVLERQCSIAKHWMAYHSTGKESIDNNLDGWDEIAASREVMPPTLYESNYSKRMERMKEDTAAHAGVTQLKKSRSVDAPYGDMRTLHENPNNSGINYEYTQNSLPRAKSDFNLTTTSPSENWDQRPVVNALYAYMPSGENQLSFEEEDKIALVGHKAKGWQFGENLRTQIFGWFPIAYTNTLNSDKVLERDQSCYENVKFQRNPGGNTDIEYKSKSLGNCNVTDNDLTNRRRNNSAEESSPTRMFGDTINLRNPKKYRGVSGTNPRPGPPPTLPAPTPSAPHSNRMLNTSQSFCSSNGVSTLERRAHKSQSGLQASHNRFLSKKKQITTSHLNSGSKKPVAKTSLHSSNDSGFANEPPPQPEVDYSDEDSSSRVPIRRRAETNTRSSREVMSWTLNRNFRSSVDSQIDDKRLKSNYRKSGSHDFKYDGMIGSDDEIMQSSGSSSIKRTKSFWKFGRNDDSILAGMSLWRHRDLVTAPNVSETPEVHAKKSSIHESEDQDDDNVHSKSNTLTRANSNYLNTNKNRKESITSMEMFGENENIYGMKSNTAKQRLLISPMQTNFTPKSRMKIMRTIEIDIENHNDSEHTIRKDEKDFQNEASDQSVLQQPTNRNLKEHEVSKKQHSLKTRNTSKNNNGGTSINHKKSNLEKVKTGHASGNTQQKQAQHEPQQKQRSNPMELLHSTEDEDESDNNGTLKMSDVNNFFDDLPQNSASGVIMKTVKRKDILKQYYTSEEESDDAEIKSTSSDPYDCIVINDHLARRDEKQRRQIHNSYQEHQMEFQTFRAASSPPSTKIKSTSVQSKSGSSKTRQDQESDRFSSNTNTLTRNSTGNNAISTPTATILPRTRLMKSTNTNSLTLERKREPKLREDKSSDIVTEKEMQFSKTYGPWYDFWDPQLQHTLPNSKAVGNLK